MVSLATAHPAKFPDAVQQATGIRPELPERLADLFDRDEPTTSSPPTSSPSNATSNGPSRVEPAGRSEQVMPTPTSNRGE